MDTLINAIEHAAAKVADVADLLRCLVLGGLLTLIYLLTPGRDPSEEAAAWDNGAP